MKKRLIIIFTLLFFLFPTTAFAFDTNNYYKDIRIGLENMAAPSITVTMLGNYTFNGQMYPSGTSFVLYYDNSKLNMNGSLYDEITFVPSNGDDLVKLKNGAKEYNFKGTMQFKVKGSSIIPVNTINIEEYLKGVVSFEMSNSYPIEALKAQAVAARNYAIMNRNKHAASGYDICDGTDCQVYRGYNPAYTNVIRAVNETSGIILLYNDEIAGCYYSASNGGSTEAAGNVWSKDVPYLQSQKDDFDSELWPTGDKKMTSADIQNMLKTKSYLQQTDTFARIDMNSISYYPSGRIANITVIYNDVSGNTLSKSYSKDSARYFLSLPSALYTVIYDQASDTYTFSGKGYGHAVGMSQIGAKNRANAGQTYDSILNFYYSGTVMKTVTARISNISKNKDNVCTGEDIIFNAVMDGQASGGQLYKYVIEKDGKTLFTREYDSSSQVVYKPLENGNYNVRLYVKSISSQNAYDEQAMTGFNAYSSALIAGVSINPDPIILNKAVQITPSISGGSSSGYDINYELIRDGNVISSSAGTPSFNFIPDKEGTLILKIRVKDKTSIKAFDDEKTFSLNVQKEKPQEPSRGDTSYFSISRQLKLGISGADVTALQNALGKLGYYTYGKTTTYFGTNTKTAVINFQKKNNLKATGIVDTETAKAINTILSRIGQQQNPSTNNGSGSSETQVLYSISRTLKSGISGNDVATLQNALAKLGYYTYGKTTTYFGTYTKNAVISFQKKNNLKATGIVDSATASAINKLLVSKAQSDASKSTAASSQPQQSSPSKTAESSTQTEFKLARNLKKGISGEDVKQLQNILIKLGYLKEKSTGYYGDCTVSAVKAFQKANKISQTGIVSTLTAQAVNRVINS